MADGSEQPASPAELEAELAKLTSELEAECANLEASDDVPVSTQNSEAGDLDTALASLLEGSDGSAGGIAPPPLDLGAGGRPPGGEGDAPAEPADEPDAGVSGFEPPDPVDQFAELDRSLADLTAQLMGDGDEGSTDRAQEVSGTPTPPAPEPAEADEPTGEPNPEPGTIPEPEGGTETPHPEPEPETEPAEPIETAEPSEPGRIARAWARVEPHYRVAHGVGSRVVRVAGPPARKLAFAAGSAAAPIGARALLLASKPVASRPKAVLDSIGWLATGTAFVAVVTWFFVLVRSPASPDAIDQPAALTDAPQGAGSGPAVPSR